MFIKNLLSIENHIIEHIQEYKKIVLKTKKICTNEFHYKIRSLKTRDPKQFWKF